VSEVWKQCEGQVVDDKFRLQQYLGGAGDSAVFLTQSGNPQSPKAAIKFIPAGTTADLQLSLWRRVKQLAHPHLLRIFDTGRCRLANRDRLYVVMEYAEEDLSQILPQRALTAAETREMLEPVLDALGYLHGSGFVHAGIKPSNILATADKLKLSSDTLLPIGETRKSSLKFDVRDAPETAASRVSAAADVWSLGVALVEGLTQKVPVLPPGNQVDPIIPDSLPQPFLDIARHTVLRDSRRRWSIPEIAARLNPAAIAAAAAQSVSPLAVPLSTVPAVPAAKLQIPKFDAPSPKAQAPRQQVTNLPKQTVVLPNYVIPLAVVLLVIAAIVALPKILGHRAESASSAATAAAQPAASQPKPVERPASRETSPLPKQAGPAAAQTSQKVAVEKKPAPPSPQSSPVSAPVPASVRTDTFPSANAPAASGSSAARGEVLDQVLPEVSGKALGTIQGVVRVTVHVHADPTGSVSEAALDSPGPSKYFADLALQAARRWQFASPDVGGHSVPSEWLIRFEFTPSGVKAFPKQSTP
jgi:TonB family protein